MGAVVDNYAKAQKSQRKQDGNAFVVCVFDACGREISRKKEQTCECECVCVCVCVCARARVYVCVCVCGGGDVWGGAACVRARVVFCT